MAGLHFLVGHFHDAERQAEGLGGPRRVTRENVLDRRCAPGAGAAETGAVVEGAIDSSREDRCSSLSRGRVLPCAGEALFEQETEWQMRHSPQCPGTHGGG